MGGVIGNINTIRNEILKQAREQADTILDRARKVSERDLFYAREEAESIKADERDKISPMLEVEQKKAIASAEMEARKMLLEKKEELVAKVFDEAQEKFEAMRGSQAYIDIITRLIEEGVLNIKEDAIVEFGEADKYIFTSEFMLSIRTKMIKALGKGLRIHFERLGNDMSGVIIKSMDGKMIVDNSFSGIFKRLKEELRGKVSEMLLQE